MYSLCMLSEIVEPGELLGAMARKRTFTSVFSTGGEASVRDRSGVVASTGAAGAQGQGQAHSQRRHVAVDDGRISFL